MTKNKTKVILAILLIFIIVIPLAACSCGTEPDTAKSKYTVSFEADGNIVHTLQTAGNETIILPFEPVKAEYSFVGWFDDISHQTEFTAAYFQNKALTADMTVYALFDRDDTGQTAARWDSNLLIVLSAESIGSNIYLEWSPSVSGGEFSLQVSEDGESFSDVACDTALYSYTYSDNTKTNLIFRVRQEVAQTVDYDDKDMPVIADCVCESNIIAMRYDGDGYTVEVTDSDNDGLPDYFEEILGTDPFGVDTDDDGLTDYFEVYISKTDPLLPDSNFDGISDGDEDPDGDGLINSLEQLNGSSPLLFDSDGDGLSDYDEVMVYNTNPVSADSDGDGISDYAEIHITNTDPLSFDSEGIVTQSDYTASLARAIVGGDYTAVSALSYDGTRYYLLHLQGTDYSDASEPAKITAQMDISTKVLGKYAEGVRLRIKSAETHPFLPSSTAGFLDGLNAFAFLANMPESKYDPAQSMTSLTYNLKTALSNSAEPVLYYLGETDGKLDEYGQPMLHEQKSTYDSYSNTVSAVLNYTGTYIVLDKAERERVLAEADLNNYQLYQSNCAYDSIEGLVPAEHPYLSDTSEDLSQQWRYRSFVYEGLAAGTIRTSTGAKVFGDYTKEEIAANNDLDGDGLANGYEAVVVSLSPRGNELRGKFRVYFTSNPLLLDSDGDEIEDAYDDAPLSGWDYEGSNLSKIIYSAGFIYSDNNDQLYSRKDASQRDYGYSYLYDEGIAAISSYINCEPVYFVYDNKEWMIEVWKGQYGVEIGAEIGVYYRELGDPTMLDKLAKNKNAIVNDVIAQIKSRYPKFPSELSDLISDAAKEVDIHKFYDVLKSALNVLRGNGSWLNQICGKIVNKSEMLKFARNCLSAAVSGLSSKFYKCASPEDYLEMSYALYMPGGDEPLIQRGSKAHWWLTGFKWGEFIDNPSNLKMDISIKFKNEEMAAAFVTGGKGDEVTKSFLTEMPMDVLDYNNDNNRIYGLKNTGYQDIADINDKLSEDRRFDYDKDVYLKYSGYYAIRGEEVLYSVGTPKQTQPFLTTLLKNVVQTANKNTVRSYNFFKSVLGLDDYNANDVDKNNDPNKLESALLNVNVDKDLFNSIISHFKKDYQEWYIQKYGVYPASEYTASDAERIVSFLIVKYNEITNEINSIVNMAFSIAKTATQ